MWLRADFKPKSLGLYRPKIHIITVTFFTFLRFFWKSKKRDFLRFLLCFTRFLELWLVGLLTSFIVITPPRYIGDGILFSIDFFVCLFVYSFPSLFLCQQYYEKTAGPICMKLSRKVWSYHGATWLHFWSIPRNRTMQRCATRGRGLLCFRTTACCELMLAFSCDVQLSSRNL